MLELYREALRIRREHPALGEGVLLWDPDAAPGVLSFSREPGFRCVVNLSARPVGLPAGERLLLASAPLVDGALGVDCAAWLEASIE
jgi:alpha-glucosidase